MMDPGRGRGLTRTDKHGPPSPERRHRSWVLICRGISAGSVGVETPGSWRTSARTWAVTCMYGGVDPRGRYSNSWQELATRLDGLRSDAGLQE